MKWFPRLQTYRGVIHVPLLVLCLAFVLLVCGAVAGLIWLIGQFY